MEWPSGRQKLMVSSISNLGFRLLSDTDKHALTTTTMAMITRDKIDPIEGSNGKRRRRTEDAEDWSRSRRQQWAARVSFNSFGGNLSILVLHRSEVSVLSFLVLSFEFEAF